MKDTFLTISPIENKNNMVKVQISGEEGKKEFFVFAISQQDLLKLENEEKGNFTK